MQILIIRPIFQLLLCINNWFDGYILSFIEQIEFFFAID